MNTPQKLKKHLRPGGVYRRADLMNWSKAVDRHLKQLLQEGVLTKLAGGLYYCPNKTVFGDAPAEEHKLVKAFLKDDRFLLTSPNAYNSLGLGLTQLYNHKRHGHFKLGGRAFDFRVKPYFPKILTAEFLLVDLVNNLDRLAEDSSRLRALLQKQVSSFNTKILRQAVQKYGNLQSTKFFAQMLVSDKVAHAAHLPS